MHVDEQRGVLAALERLLANDMSQVTAGALFLGGQEQHQRRGVLRQLAAYQGFVRKQQAGLDLDDRLEHHVDVVASDRANAAWRPQFDWGRR